MLNDTYGHLKGDERLKDIGGVLKNYGKRPDDISARYGGEEFVVGFGNSAMELSSILITKLLDDIRSLNIPNENDYVRSRITIF